MANSEVDRRYKERDFSGLVELADEGDPDERRAALSSLGALRRGHVVDAVTRALLHDEHEAVQVTAARVLASLDGEAARRALLDAEPAAPGVRQAVALALGILGERGAEAKLNRMLADPDTGVRAGISGLHPDLAVPSRRTGARPGDGRTRRRSPRPQTQL